MVPGLCRDPGRKAAGQSGRGQKTCETVLIRKSRGTRILWDVNLIRSRTVSLSRVSMSHEIIKFETSNLQFWIEKYLRNEDTFQVILNCFQISIFKLSLYSSKAKFSHRILCWNYFLLGSSFIIIQTLKFLMANVIRQNDIWKHIYAT